MTENISTVITRAAVKPDNLAPAGTYERPSLLCDAECSTCGGSGYVGYDVPVTDSRFGKLFPCPHRDIDLTGWAGLDRSEKDMDWDQVVDVNDLHSAINAVQKAMKRGWGWVYLWGGYGLGKTLILKIAVAVWIRGRGRAVYVQMGEMLSDMRLAYDADDQNREAQRRLDKWAGVELLALDEMDKINETEWATSRRFELLDKRHVSSTRGQSITLMASNHPPSKLPGSIQDRLRTGAYDIVEIKGSSFRPAMEEEWIQETFQ